MTDSEARIYGESEDDESEPIETPPPMPEKKEKKPLTETQLSTLAKARQKASENRKMRTEKTQAIESPTPEPKPTPENRPEIKPKPVRKKPVKLPAETPQILNEEIVSKRYFKHNIARGFLMYDETE